MLDLPDWPGHRAGQHVDVRLTAEDGYQAERSYSIASAPEDDRLVLTVERLDDGEVSPYLVDVLQPGDELELRGPIGGYFVWEESLGGPLLLIAGGSGVVPLRAMLRHRAAGQQRRAGAAAVLLALARRADLPRRAADGPPDDGVDVEITLTREWPRRLERAARPDRRRAARQARMAAVASMPLVYVCGPTAFVENVAQTLVAAGHDPRGSGPSGSGRRGPERRWTRSTETRSPARCSRCTAPR